MTTDKARTIIYLDESVKEWLRKEAKRNNRSMSNYIESLLISLKDGHISLDDLD